MTTCTFCKKEAPVACQFSGQAEFCHRMKPADEAAALAAVAEAVDVPTFADGVPVPPKPSFTEADAVALLRKASEAPAPKPMSIQIGGDHYKSMPIQPLTYIEANQMGFSEANVVKYVTRWKTKNGIEDLKKARDILDKKIAFEEEQARLGLMGYLSALFKTV